MLRQAVVLVGGAGTRLGELTKATPKPLLNVGGKPFLDYVLWNLMRHGVQEIVLSAGYLSQTFEDYLSRGEHDGLRIRLRIEPEPLGTGGALLHARNDLDDTFLVLNGDTLFELNYLDLASSLRKPQLASIALRHVPDTARYGNVQRAGDLVIEFSEKAASGPGWINGGVYAMAQEALDFSPGARFSLETDLLPRLARNGMLVAQPFDGYFVDIGLPDTLESARAHLPKWQTKPAVFFDRDGVINVDKGYVHTPSQFSFQPGAVEAIKWLNDRGYLVFVVTNQAGIARGYYTEDSYQAFEAWIDAQLALAGAHIDRTYHCPHHPSAGIGPLGTACECRKPGPGMIRTALREWRVDADRSILIGDKDSDVVAANRAGIRGVKYSGGDLGAFVRDALGSAVVA